MGCLSDGLWLERVKFFPKLMENVKNWKIKLKCPASKEKNEWFITKAKEVRWWIYASLHFAVTHGEGVVFLCSASNFFKHCLLHTNYICYHAVNTQQCTSTVICRGTITRPPYVTAKMAVATIAFHSGLEETRLPL